MSEAQLQRAIVDAATRLGFLVFHDLDSRQNAAGFPDLVLVRPPYVLFLELKTEKGRAREEQLTWLRQLRLSTKIRTALVRPRHLDNLLAALAQISTERDRISHGRNNRASNQDSEGNRI
jgi:hypothetical protein